VEDEGDDGGVVDIGVQVVLELERPAARCEVRLADRPVALGRDLLAQEVLARLLECRMVGRHAAGP
jgi:hypothetical protein